jgi:tetratricopeptide (TPR) repeat protein
MGSLAAGFKDLMKGEMEKEKDKLAALEERLARTNNAATTPSSSSWSWEESYRQFDRLDIDSREELEAKINLARSNLEKMNGAQSNLKACSHRHPCHCSQNRAAEVEVMAMKTSQRLEKMKEFKLEGNALFKSNKYHEALVQYNRALIFYEYCFDAVDAQRRELEHIRLLCLLNAAACTLHLESYKQCIEFCNEALDIDDMNPKAYFRRAKARRLLDQYDYAKRDLDKVVELCKGKKCEDLHREMMLLQQCEEQYEQAILEFALRAIGGPSTEGQADNR